MSGELERLEAEYKEAAERFAHGVVREFHVGQFVRVKWGIGSMAGVVRFHPWSSSEPGRLGIEHRMSHRIHWKDWKDILAPST